MQIISNTNDLQKFYNGAFFLGKKQTYWKQLRALINPLIHNPCIYQSVFTE